MNQPVDVREAEERLRNLRAIHVRIDYQKTHTDYFDLWRAGDGRAFQYDKQLRQVVISYLVFPRPGRWPGHGASVAQGRRTRPYRIQKLRTSDGPQSNRRRADKVAERMEQMLAFGGLRITKILGWGGQGIACAVEGEKANGEPIKLVCKASLGSKGIHEEKLNHILMAGAKHVVQRVVLADRPEEKETAHGQSRETMDLDETLFFIEFMRRGDLKGILNKAAVRKTPFPNRVLWQILDCLFAGVVAMAFPNKWHDPRADPISEQMPQRREVPTGQWDLNATEETMVHFDLDPLNVLVGDFDDGEHSTAPVVKIADLGLARVVDLDFRLDWEDMWGARRCGKVDSFTPEQFAEEWDWINYVPYMHHDAMEKETAGNYHWWTNMYQVAQIMWQLITLCHLEWPPVLEEYWDTHPDGSVKRSWTYGGALLRDEFIHVDMDLRWLIAQCMSHSPFDRPSMGDIDWAIQRHFDRPGPSADERLAVRSFWEAMDGDPSPPAASQPANLAGVAAAAAKAQAMRPVPSPGAQAPVPKWSSGARKAGWGPSPAAQAQPVGQPPQARAGGRPSGSTAHVHPARRAQIQRAGRAAKAQQEGKAPQAQPEPQLPARQAQAQPAGQRPDTHAVGRRPPSRPAAERRCPQPRAQAAGRRSPPAGRAQPNRERARQWRPIRWWEE